MQAVKLQTLVQTIKKKKHIWIIIFIINIYYNVIIINKNLIFNTDT
jgi:hypothetical protein